MSRPSCETVVIPRSEMNRRTVGGFVAALALAAVARPVVAEVDHREMKAREDFAAGRYQDALDIFVKLYAEKLHPNYLRYIGRCYQNLGDPAKAVSSFNGEKGEGRG